MLEQIVIYNSSGKKYKYGTFYYLQPAPLKGK